MAKSDMLDAKPSCPAPCRGSLFFLLVFNESYHVVHLVKVSPPAKIEHYAFSSPKERWGKIPQLFCSLRQLEWEVEQMGADRSR